MSEERVTGMTKKLPNYSYVKMSRTIQGVSCNYKSEKYMAYCHYKPHLGYLTKEDIACHKCLEKRCRYFEKVQLHKWEVEEIKKANVKFLRKVRKRYLSGEVPSQLFSELEKEYKSRDYQDFYARYTNIIDIEYIVENKSIVFDEEDTKDYKAVAKEVSEKFTKNMQELTKSVNEYIYSAYNKLESDSVRTDLVQELSSKIKEITEDTINKVSNEVIVEIDKTEFICKLTSKLEEVMEDVILQFADSFEEYTQTHTLTNEEVEELKEEIAMTGEAIVIETTSVIEEEKEVDLKENEVQIPKSEENKMKRDAKKYMGKKKKAFLTGEMQEDEFKEIQSAYMTLSKVEFYNKYVSGCDK